MSSVVSPDLNDYESLLVALQNVLGIVVTDDQRSSLLMRIESLLSSNNIDSIAALTKILSENNEIKSTLLETLSLPHSSWHLANDIKKVLHDYIFSQLPEKAKICIVGCGQGQLAYGVAMEIAEYENKSGEANNFQLIATDGVASDLEIAEAALYTSQQLSSLSPEYKKLYTAAGTAADVFKIKDRIRQKVTFLQYNLATDLATNVKSPKDIDLVICPEALAYFTNGDKARITLQLSEMLKPGGIFLTSDNQSILPQAVISKNKSLERVQHPSGDFYRCIN